MPDDKLKLKIKAEVGRSGSIATLAENLKKLKAAANSPQIEALGKSLEKLAEGLEAMRDAPTLNANTVKNLVELSNTLKGLQEIPDMSNLETLSSLKAIEGVKINKPLVNNIKSLVDVANQIKGGEIAKLGLFATALRELNNVNIPRTFGTLAKNMGPMIEATKKLDKDFAPKIRQLSRALTPLSKLPKSQLSSYITPLSKLGKAIVDINNTKLSEMEKAIKKVQELLRQVDALDGAKLQKITGQPAKRYGGFGAGGGGSGKDFDFWARAGLAFVGLKSAFGFMGKVVAKSNEYVENMNLFTVAMGEYAEEAEKYADRVQEALGVDKSDWIRAQGMYKQILSGFGVEADQAYSFSKILTQLTYDMASFYNISEQLAHQKLASGISGELEPLRRLGYALDQATLQQLAYSQGINILVRDMTQAEKAQLRMLAIYQQSKNAMGDMSRTILTPANAMRVLTSTVNRAARAIANSLIPIIMALMPYLQALAELVIMVANAIATWLGFELPTIDYSDIKGNVGGLEEDFNAVGDAAEGATAKAKEFKAFLAGFDELHVIPEPPKDAGGGGKGGGPAAGGGPRFKLDIPDYDFLQGKNTQVKAIVDKVLGFVRKIKNALGPFWETIKQIGKGILGWAGFSKIADFFTSILGIEGPMKKMVKGIAVVVGSAVLGAWETYKAWRAYYNYEIDRTELFVKSLGTFIGQAIPTFIAFMQMGVPVPIAGALAVVLSLVTQVVGACKAWRDHLEDMAKDQLFGNITLSLQEVQELAEQLTRTEYTIKLGVAHDAIEKVESTMQQFEASYHEMELWEIKMRLGIETDFDELTNMIINAADSIQAYADANIDSVIINFGLAFGESASTDNLISDVTSDFVEWDTEVNILKNELKKIISNTELTEEEKREAAMKIAQQIQEILEKVNEYKMLFEQNKKLIEIGEMIDFEIDVDDLGGLDFESLKKVGEQVANTIKEQQELHQEHVVEVKTLLKTKLDMDPSFQDEYDRQMAELEKSLPYKELEIIVKPVVKAMDTLAPELLNAVAEAVGSITPEQVQKATAMMGALSRDINQFLVLHITDAINDMDLTGEFDVTKFQANVESLYNVAIDVLAEQTNTDAKTIKNIMNELFDAMFDPHMADASDLVRQIAQQGGTVTEETQRFFLQAAETAALGGQEWGREFLTGFKLSEHPEWPQILMAIQDDAGEIPENVKLGVLANMQPILDSLAEMTELEMERLRPLLEALGFNLDAWIAAGMPTDSAALKELQGNLDDLGDELENSTPGLSQKSKDVGEAATQPAKDAMENARVPNTMSEVVTDLSTELTSRKGELESCAYNLGSGTMSQMNTGINSVDIITPVETKFESVMRKLQEYGTKIGTFFSDLWKEITGQDNDIKERLANITQNGSPQKVKVPELKLRASGGLPDIGEIFVAREAGPELVGSIGGRTAVANNFQIVSGISHGVFAATSSAMANFASGMGQLLRSMNSPVYRRYDTEQDGANEDRITREDFNYGLGVLTQAIVGAIQESNDQEIKIDDEAIGRVVRRQMHRVSTVEG